jgi:integrase/recombinase XerD
LGQAKTFTDAEFERLLAFLATQPHAARNRAMVLMTFWAGLRVGEVAQLRFGDVFDGERRPRAEIPLDPAITKGRHARTVFVAQKLRDELSHYGKTHPTGDLKDCLSPTQKHPRHGFTPNTCAQHFLTMYKRAGIENLSSHSGRRTFITQLANKGVTVRVLASLAGHRSIATTQRYIDVNGEMNRSAVAIIWWATRAALRTG